MKGAGKRLLITNQS